MTDPSRHSGPKAWSQNLGEELIDEASSIEAAFPLPIANLKLDSSSPLPIHEQICQAIRTAIWSHQLPPGTALPTSKELSRFLGVARNTVVLAYVRLVDEGICVSNTRRGTRVASDVPGLSDTSTTPKAETKSSTTVTLRASYAVSHALETLVSRVSGGVPFTLFASDPVLYPRTKLGRRFADKFLSAPPAVHLSTAASGRNANFQKSIAAYLRQSRGVVCDPEQVIPVPGLESALSLTTGVLIDPGDCVAVEDPAMDVVHSAFSLARAHMYPLPSDAYGPDVGQMKAPPARLIYVSPSVSFPFGAQMIEQRRMDILAAARAQNSIVFESDTCGSLRYSGARIAALQGLDSDKRVIHYGGFLETLGSFVNVGYLVVPESLCDPFFELARRVVTAPPLPVLDAIAEFVDEHEYDGHTRTVRAVFAKRLDAVKKTFKQLIPHARVSEPLGGLHIVLQFSGDFDEELVAKRAMSEGLPVRPLSHYFQRRDEKGLVLGFGAISDQAVPNMAERLAELIHRMAANNAA